MAKDIIQGAARPHQYQAALDYVRKQNIGRPSTFNQEIADYVIWEMTENGTDFAKACRKCGIPKSTVHSWAAKNPEFSDLLDEGRQAIADHCASQIIDLSENVEDPMGDRIRLDALKWIAARYHPKRYSEKGSVALTGAGGGPIQMQAVQSVNLDQLNELDREAFKRAMIAASKAAGEDVTEYED